jgi:NAD(P)-dependent dehydrogenase (short-subunit alcohol dehydrogenase family)
MPVTLVTGSSTGIGRATALHLAREGHRVWASMRDLARGNALREAAESESLPIERVRLDVTDPASVEAAVASVLDSAGRIDNLICNAGFHAGHAMEDTELEVYQRLLDTNFLGGIRCIKAVLPRMRERGSGCVVGVTSQSGRLVHPTLSAYSASKFAMEAALEALALEVAGFGIRVAIVEPGLTFTAAQSKAEPRPTGTPYQKLYQRTGALFANDAGVASSAEQVAAAISEAIHGGEAKLRHLVGRDAERNASGRSRVSDEEWVAMHGAEADDEFHEQWAAAFGTDPRGG